MKVSSVSQRKSAVAPVEDVHAKQSLRLWIKLLMTTTIIEKKVRLFLKDNCSTTLPRFDVMATLFREKGKITMSQLSEKLLVSNGNVTGVVSRLVEDGLVVRQTDENDRRVQYVTLSSRGRAAFVQAAGEHESLIDSVFGELQDDEIATLISLLDNVQERARSKIESL